LKKPLVTSLIIELVAITGGHSKFETLSAVDSSSRYTCRYISGESSTKYGTSDSLPSGWDSFPQFAGLILFPLDAGYILPRKTSKPIVAPL
jgi:hypothetical protein